MTKVTIYNRTPEILSMTEALELVMEVEERILAEDGFYIMDDCAVEKVTRKKGTVYFVAVGVKK